MRSYGWLFLALSSAGCVAHLPRPDEPTLALERSYFGASTARDQTVEASPAFHLVLANGLADPGIYVHGGTALNATASFLTTLRLAREESAPVRTPTYEPRLKLQGVHVTPFGGRSADPELAPSPVRLTALEVVIGHRSNGQRGCSLAAHQRLPGGDDFDCSPLSSPESAALNLEDGSFTTNYVGANAIVRLLFPGPTDGPAAGALTAGAGTEFHVPCSSGSCMAPQMRERYGGWRATWTLEGELLVLRDVERVLPAVGSVHLDSSLRTTLSGDVHLGAARGPFGSFSAEVAMLPRHPRGYVVGLFARRHQGSDYLNIRFEQRLDAWFFGVVLDPSPLERLGDDAPGR